MQTQFALSEDHMFTWSVGKYSYVRSEGSSIKTVVMVVRRRLLVSYTHDSQ